MRFQGRTRLFVVLGFVLAIMSQLISVQSSVANDKVGTKASTTAETYLPVTVNNYPWVTSFGAQVTPTSPALSRRRNLTLRFPRYPW